MAKRKTVTVRVALAIDYHGNVRVDRSSLDEAEFQLPFSAADALHWLVADVPIPKRLMPGTIRGKLEPARRRIRIKE